MKRKTVTLSLLLITSATSTLAQPPSGRPNRTANGTTSQRSDPIIQALDLDDDKTISAEEIRNASVALLSLDKNKNGALSQDEFRIQNRTLRPVNSRMEPQKDEIPSSPKEEFTTEGAIQWFATLSRGLAEAERTGKPILFVSGNPSCAGVSGMWCPGKGNIDSTYLHQREVVEAAKKFVCIRLTAYEDESERQFMSKLVMGQVSNTAFAILGPDGTPAIQNKGTGKGPSGLYKDAAEMATGMNSIAARYRPNTTDGATDGATALPIALNAKVGLVVAAADNQPLILVLASTPDRQQELERKVAALAWTKSFTGRFVYATASSMNELPKVQGSSIADGVVMIEPDIFGAGGKIVAEVSGDQHEEQIAAAMRKTAQNFVPIEKSRRELPSLGLNAGIFYETGIPVSGKGEANDRERYLQRLNSKKSN